MRDLLMPILAECHGYESYMKTKKRMTPGADNDNSRKLPSVVTWLQPKCFLQGRPKQQMFTARMPRAACADEADQHDVEGYWHNLGCSEEEFRHVITSANAPSETPIRTQMVDLGNEGVCSDLRSKWADGGLFLKDSGPGDLFETGGATKTMQETLVETISDNLYHLLHYQEEKDHMTGAEMRQWLRASWQDSKKEGQQVEDREGRWTSDWVKDCSFDPTRSIDDAGEVLLPLLLWFNSAYPYYQQQCTCCGNEHATNLLATAKSSPMEHTFEATRTELYHCTACESYYRIPRYNQIRKILEEGRWRCGEYSMIFHHLMSALGYNARWIVDWSDHCWLEIKVGRKWVHMDPSVGVWNDKDMYKNDWNKRHMIILAFCQDGCQDVTEA